MKFLKFLPVILLLPISSQAKDKLECTSFAGSWSRASIQRLEDGTYKLEVKFWGTDPKVYLGEMNFLKYRDRDKLDDSPYEEVYYSFSSEELKDLKIDYTQTSDGPDYLDLKSTKKSSRLSCK